MRDTLDGTSNTIMIVQAAAAKAVVWTKPDDFAFDIGVPDLRLSGCHEMAGFTWPWRMAVFGVFPPRWTPKLLSSLYTRNGGEKIDWQAVYARLAVAESA